jgi:Ni,Fe-hydrogenase III small subunit
MVAWSRKKSPWVLHFNSGSCNGCDIEIVAALTPRLDLERVGVLLKGTPRHADILLATGPVTLKQAKRLRRIYDQMPEPKCVIAVGNCAATGDVFKGLYNVEEGIDKVLPVAMYIAGCPPRPDEIIDGALTALDLLYGKKEK